MVLFLFQRLSVPAALPEPDAVILRSAILQDGPESSSRWVWWVRGRLISIVWSCVGSFYCGLAAMQDTPKEAG